MKGGFPGIISPEGQDMQVAERLYDVSMQLVGLKK
jgi:hypothetical protein